MELVLGVVAAPFVLSAAVLAFCMAAILLYASCVGVVGFFIGVGIYKGLGMPDDFGMSMSLTIGILLAIGAVFDLGGARK